MKNTAGGDESRKLQMQLWEGNPDQENSDQEFSFWHSIDTEHYDRGFHSHNFIEIYLSVSGADKLILADRIYEVRPRDLFVINSLQVHRFMTKRDAVYERYVMEFQQSLAMNFRTDKTDLLWYLHNQGDGFVDRISLSEEQFQTMMMLFQRYESIEPEGYGSDVLYRIRFVQILLFVARLFRDAAASGREADGSSIQSLASEDTVTAILAHVEEHFREKLTLDSLADDLGFSKYHLCKLFKKRTGSTINSYITKRRIAHAKGLLLQGYTSTEVCHRCGFSNLSHFTRTFHREVGVSPGRYTSDLIGANASDVLQIQIREGADVTDREG